MVYHFLEVQSSTMYFQVEKFNIGMPHNVFLSHAFLLHQLKDVVVAVCCRSPKENNPFTLSVTIGIMTVSMYSPILRNLHCANHILALHYTVEGLELHPTLSVLNYEIGVISNLAYSILKTSK